MATSPLEFDPIVLPKIRGHTVLDVGCGYGKWGFLIKKYFWITVDGNATSSPRVFGIDKYLPGLNELRKHQVYDGLAWTDAVLLPFGSKEFDTVVATEVIEHIPKDKGALLLSELERVARHCIIISTPATREIRGGLDGLYGYNPYEAHVSCWRPTELTRMGFRCYGVGLRYGPGWLRFSLSPLAYILPGLATNVVGVKLLS